MPGETLQLSAELWSLICRAKSAAQKKSPAYRLNTRSGAEAGDVLLSSPVHPHGQRFCAYARINDAIVMAMVLGCQAQCVLIAAPASQQWSSAGHGMGWCNTWLARTL